MLLYMPWIHKKRLHYEYYDSKWKYVFHLLRWNMQDRQYITLISISAEYATLTWTVPNIVQWWIAQCYILYKKQLMTDPILPDFSWQTSVKLLTILTTQDIYLHTLNMLKSNSFPQEIINWYQNISLIINHVLKQRLQLSMEVS